MKNSFRGSVGNRFTWSRWWLAAGLAAGLSVSFSTTALADDMDAAITVFPSSYWAFPQMAQVYTALHTGQLYQISLDAGTGYAYAPVTIAVTTLTNDAPSSTALATLYAQTPASVLGPNLAWRTYTLNPRVPVTAGTKYAIVTAAGTFGSLGNYFRWGYTDVSNANFTGGGMLVRYFNGGTWSPLGTSSWGFDFKTWVASSTGPQVGYDNAAGATAPEGTAPTMTGTYSNPAGGAVKLEADHGQVTDLGGGRWSWTGDVYDEDAAPSSITIKLTDSLNQTATATFPLTIKGVKPTVSISTSSLKAAASAASSSLSNPEGTTLILNGSAASPDPTDQAGIFTYKWKVTMNGLAQPDGTSSSYSIPTVDEADTWVATFTATDDGGMVSDAVSVTVVGAEVTPTPTITSITPSDSTLTFVAPGETLNFNGTYADLSVETHTFRWDFGDGASATTLAASHAYGVGGTYTVTLTVKDDEKVSATATATVNVLTTQQALAAMVSYVQGIKTLNPGQQNSLIAKLNAASDSTARGDNKAAGNELNAFLNELEADLKTGKISAVAYNALRADAHALQSALGTYNRFLEWWPLPA